MANDETFDVCVVGAGLSGLSCADALLEQQPGLRVVVFEINNRVGGRTKTDALAIDGGGHVTVDSGGMWVGPQHREMHKLLARFGLATVPQYDHGKHVLVQGAAVWKAYEGDIPPHNILSLLELQLRVLAPIDKLAQTVDLLDPSRTPNAAALDAQSVASYFGSFLWSRAARDTVNLVCLATLGCEASQVSLLQLLYVIKSCEGLRALIDVRGGAQEARVVGGTQQLSERLAAAVIARGGEVRLGCQVARIALAAGGGVELTVAGNAGDRRVRARAVVSAAIPSVALRQIEFAPRLPSRLEQVAARTFRGAYAKAVVVYARPWWRAAGFSGFGTNTEPDVEHCVAFCYDYCGMQPPAGDAEQFALVCFFCGDVAVRAADLSPEARRASVLASLQRLFPQHSAEAGAPVLVHDMLWHRDAVATGCPVTVFPPGQFRPFALAATLGRPLASSADAAARPVLFFASTDVSTEWGAYMEGAVRRGLAVAREVRDALAFAAPPVAPGEAALAWMSA